MADTKLFIDGAWVDAKSGEAFPTFAPSTGEKIADVAKAGREDAQAAIHAARNAADNGPWPKMSGKERAEKLRKVAEIITARSAEISEIEARDGGGTIKKAMFADVPGGASSFTFFADCAENTPDIQERPESPFPPAKSIVRFEPFGVTTGIVPWNFPFIMASWKIAPSIAAGNTCVLKPASFTSLSAIEMVKACEEADIPPGVVNLITGPGGSAGEELAQHPDVDKVAFTGSTEVGRRIMQLASGTVKKVTLELGGKSANIVLDDADLDLAAAGVLWGTFFHNGQVCESGTRALVSRQDLRRVRRPARGARRQDRHRRQHGHEHRPRPARRAVAGRHGRALREARSRRGRQVAVWWLEADRPRRGLDPSAFYLPTIFEADNSMKIAQEEIFGPVLCVIPFDSDDEAIKIANDSIYGLGGGVWSKNLDRAHGVAAGMRTGTVWINDYHMISPQQPFGGYKQSGIGRELGDFGYDEYRQIKHVWQNTSTDRSGYLHFSALSANI